MTPALDQLRSLLRADLDAQRLPASTYRLQFHSGFTFRHATELVPYLHELGITHAYASPLLKARPGSRHGYDITDHSQINPEIGSEADYAAWSDALRERGMGLILDIVPNHMAVVGNENVWWNDVLENGPSSPYASFFDIAWSASTRPEMQGRILIPILGDPFAKVLEAQQLPLHYEAGAFTIRYFEHRFPVAPRSYGLILGYRLEELEKRLGSLDPAFAEYQSILTAVKHLPRRTETDPALIAERRREKEVVKRRLAALTAEQPAVREFLETTIAHFNGQTGEPHSFDLLEELLDDQTYRLSFWRVAADEINYRRFFDVNDLAALSMERPEVFAATHGLILRLLIDGRASGVRIDHPDGLFDPRQYLQRLQQEFVLGRASALAAAIPDIDEDDIKTVVSERGREPRWPLYTIVEKILGGDETMSDDWPMHGTSGYDFLNLVNGLFVDGNHAQAFTRLYVDWVQDDTTFAELVYLKKILILQIALSGEMQMLTHQLDRLAQKRRWSRDFTFNSLRRVLREVIACFPVYRSYIVGGEINDSDRKHVLRAVRRGMARNPALSNSLFYFVRDTLLLRTGPGGADADYAAEQVRFVGKFQQVTAPVMAKGAEDTACYIYNRLLSLNEVGGNPDQFGVPPNVLHQALKDRQERHPWALSATATHDTKRGEDVRARLNVLSEIPDEWQRRFTRWSRLNAKHRVIVDDTPAPDDNEEYFLYQTLLGAWPIDMSTAAEQACFTERIQAYMEKAVHEAKVHTSWINPNAAYDEAMRQFVAVLLDPERSAEFLADFRDFQKTISHAGMWNSLAQTLIKIAAPGAPDFYQGTELWDYSLVDPDNRRPVDFHRRAQMLRDVMAHAESRPDGRRDFLNHLIATKEDGRIKLFVTALGLRCRRDHPELFTKGDYVPIETSGPRGSHVFCFLRRYESMLALVVVPRLLARIVGPDTSPCEAGLWRGTHLTLPGMPEMRWRNIFTEEVVTARANDVPIEDLVRHFPVALLIAQV
jgi:(1->4)-alpha-D-glucan 1-alpha-D-glucosylmutase